LGGEGVDGAGCVDHSGAREGAVMYGGDIVAVLGMVSFIAVLMIAHRSER